MAAVILRRRRLPTRDEIRRAVPTLSAGVEIGGSTKALVLTMLLQRRPGVWGWLARRTNHPTQHEIELDEIGSFAVGRIDGKRTVAGIASDLSNKYKITKHEAEASLLEFIDSLRKRGYVTLIRK